MSGTQHVHDDIAGDRPNRSAGVFTGTASVSSRVQAMSALRPKADIAQHGVNVRFVPKSDMPSRRSRGQ
jgi:hypothetical protein